jgi:hypothetical protein
MGPNSRKKLWEQGSNRRSATPRVGGLAWGLEWKLCTKVAVKSIARLVDRA